jgi:tetratricopeptide (TPR) repeat protein
VDIHASKMLLMPRWVFDGLCRLTLLLVLGNLNSVFAQSRLPKSKNDSLWSVWNNTKEADTSRLKALHDIAREGYLFSQPDSAYHFAQIELEFARSKGLNIQMASALNTMGISFFFRGDYDKAIELYEESLQRSEEANDTLGMGNAYSNIGLVKRRQGDLQLALEFYQKALALQTAINNEKGMAILFNNIGSILTDLGDIRQSLDNHHRSLRLYEKLGDKKGMASSYNNIGIIHIGQKDKAEALKYFKQGLALAEEFGDKPFMTSGCYNIGNIYNELKQYDLALEFLQRALQLQMELGDRKGLSGSYNSIGSVYLAINDQALAKEYFEKSIEAGEAINDRKALTDAYNSLSFLYSKNDDKQGLAESYGLKSLGYAQELGIPDKIKNAALTLSGIYRKKGQYKQALESYELYISMRDSIISESNQKELMRKQFEYDYDKKEALLAAEQEKKDALAKEQLQRRGLYLAAAAGITFLLSIISFILYLFYRSRTKANAALEKKNTEVQQQKAVVDARNHEIMQSFNYARRLQEAVMPGEAALKNHFSDSFLLYRPRDVVSGDFYWTANRNGIIYLAVGDCTGHGVPGAMLSVIGLNSLNRCISDLGLTRPKDVLMQMTIDLLITFEAADAQVRDGMDIALCAIDTRTNTLTYSGANNPLWVARQGEMLVFKADRRAVGYHDGETVFTQQEVALQQGDAIYLMSDGFQDQLGGPDDRKFMTKKLRETIVSISHLPMAEQHTTLDRAFTQWRSNREQTDDVCVVGVRLG